MAEQGLPSRPLTVFLCHSSGDKPAVRKLYRRLRTAGFEPWLDEEALLPGQDLKHEIARAVRDADAVVVCLSNDSVGKEGFVQREIKYALDAASEKPRGTIFLIPLRLQECEVPEDMRHLTWVNLFEEQGYGRLVRALQRRAEQLGVSGNPLPPPRPGPGGR